VIIHEAPQPAHHSSSFYSGERQGEAHPHS
jgi:hypothetical protein